jgi:hypothetical protein
MGIDGVAESAVVSVQTAPPAAAVLQDGSELGKTPLDVSLNRGSTLTLLLKKKGFESHKLELRAEDGARVVQLRRLPAPKARDLRSSPASTADGSAALNEDLSSGEPPTNHFDSRTQPTARTN